MCGRGPTRPKAERAENLNFHDFFHADEGHLIGTSEGEGEFNSVKLPGSNEVDGTIDRFEITGFGGVARPFIRPLEVKPSGDIPQKRFHTLPSRTSGPTNLVSDLSIRGAMLIFPQKAGKMTLAVGIGA